MLLHRAPHRPDPGLAFLGGLHLARGRVHEAHGPARQLFALMVARAQAPPQTDPGADPGEHPVFWIAPGWEASRLYAPGVIQAGVDPGRLTHVAGEHPMDLLWAMEEVLRSGAVPLVVAELPAPPGLTPMRRLQLAAEAGAEKGPAPIGLVLTPEGGAAGSESRWSLRQDHGATERRWHLARERDRSLPPGDWTVLPAGTERPGYALAPAG